MKDLKQRALRGGLAKICAQGANFAVRLGSLMVLARLLDPKDFGLVGMVTAVIGIFSVFRDFGLSAATVQRGTVTGDQISTLFWINILVGGFLGLLALALAPFMVTFYHEPRLFRVTAVLATGFLFNAAGVQHVAILERQMRFTTLSLIDVVTLVAASSIGVWMALHGYGYWALVATAVVTPFVSTLCVWSITGWVPGKPRRRAGVRSMLRFGSTVTLNGFIIYIATNLEKVLLGRFWGADAIGLYGRAYQLINIPTENLNSSAGAVAFAALSRLRDQPDRLRSYFLKGYSLVLSLTVPITFAGVLFASDTIRVFLGPKWKDTAPVFRLLAPTILVFATVNPLGWLLTSLGFVERGLKIALTLAPVMIVGYSMGLPYGPRGVAIGYSSVMVLLLLPLIIWATHGTMISVRDIVTTAMRPLLSGVVATVVAVGLDFSYRAITSPLLHLAAGASIFLTVYVLMLLYVMGQKALYLDLIRGFAKGSPADSADATVPVREGQDSSIRGERADVAVAGS